jgi:hypothetical protein
MPARVDSATVAIAAMPDPIARCDHTNKKWAEAHFNLKRLEV